MHISMFGALIGPTLSAAGVADLFNAPVGGVLLAAGLTMTVMAGIIVWLS